jgi:prephenate dehydrogenase
VLIQNLQDYAQALRAKDVDKLRALLKEGREMKATAGGN